MCRHFSRSDFASSALPPASSKRVGQFLSLSFLADDSSEVCVVHCRQHSLRRRATFLLPAAIDRRHFLHTDISYKIDTSAYITSLASWLYARTLASSILDFSFDAPCLSSFCYLPSRLFQRKSRFSATAKYTFKKVPDIIRPLITFDTGGAFCDYCPGPEGRLYHIA